MCAHKKKVCMTRYNFLLFLLSFVSFQVPGQLVVVYRETEPTTSDIEASTILKIRFAVKSEAQRFFQSMQQRMTFAMGDVQHETVESSGGGGGAEGGAYANVQWDRSTVGSREGPAPEGASVTAAFDLVAAAGSGFQASQGADAGEPGQQDTIINKAKRDTAAVTAGVVDVPQRVRTPVQWLDLSPYYTGVDTDVESLASAYAFANSDIGSLKADMEWLYSHVASLAGEGTGGARVDADVVSQCQLIAAAMEPAITRATRAIEILDMEEAGEEVGAEGDDEEDENIFAASAEHHANLSPSFLPQSGLIVARITQTYRAIAGPGSANSSTAASKVATSYSVLLNATIFYFMLLASLLLHTVT